MLIYSITVRHGFDQVLPNANRTYLTVQSQKHRTAPHRIAGPSKYEGAHHTPPRDYKHLIAVRWYTMRSLEEKTKFPSCPRSKRNVWLRTTLTGLKHSFCTYNIYYTRYSTAGHIIHIIPGIIYPIYTRCTAYHSTITYCICT